MLDKTAQHFVFKQRAALGVGLLGVRFAGAAPAALLSAACDAAAPSVSPEERSAAGCQSGAGLQSAPVATHPAGALSARARHHHLPALAVHLSAALTRARRLRAGRRAQNTLGRQSGGAQYPRAPAQLAPIERGPAVLWSDGQGRGVLRYTCLECHMKWGLWNSYHTFR